jgi:hypothetical protein
MAVRNSMASLITRVRTLINDPSSTSQIFDDQTIQDVLDYGRLDVVNEVMTPKPTFTGASIQFLNYYTQLGDWEDDIVFKQYLVTPVTPATLEPIAGHIVFAATTLPPIYWTGKTYDVYRAAADLLERQAAQWMLRFSFSSDGQSVQRSQAHTMILDLATTYRQQQRPREISLIRSDMRSRDNMAGAGLGPLEIDYMGDGSGH